MVEIPRFNIIESIVDAFAYESKEGFAYTLDPRVKIVYVICVMITIFLFNDPFKLILVLLSHIPLVVASRLSRKILNLFKALSVFLVFLICFNVVVTYVFEGFRLELYNLLNSTLLMVIRVAVALTSLSLLILTTSPWELMQALTKMRISYTYLYSFIIAYRFVPIIFNEMKNIYDAQRSRGLELEKGSIFTRARRLIPIIIPTIVCALLRARDLAEAMEAKGFGYSKNRSFYKPIRIKPTDIAFITIYIVFLVLLGSWDKLIAFVINNVHLSSSPMLTMFR